MARFRRIAVTIASSAAMLGPCAAPAQENQEPEVAALTQRIEIIAAEIQSLQGQLYRLGLVGSDRTVPGQVQLLVRLQDQEAAIQAVTGEIETLRFALNEIVDRFERLSTALAEQLEELSRRNEQQVQLEQRVRQIEQTIERIAARAAQERSVSTPMPQEDPGLAGEEMASLQDAAALNPEQQFESAIRTMSQGNAPARARAIQLFEGFLERHPEHELANESHFWLGEIYLREKQYVRAAKAFRRSFVIDQTAPVAVKALLKMATALRGSEDRTEACVVLRDLFRRFDDISGSLRIMAQREQQLSQC